jgi:hypothetical protein
MGHMTEKEADQLDELLTKTTPTVNFDKPGVFARQKDMLVALDSFASRYIMSKSIATKRTPTELISEMIRNEIKAAL